MKKVPTVGPGYFRFDLLHSQQTGKFSSHSFAVSTQTSSLVFINTTCLLLSFEADLAALGTATCTSHVFNDAMEIVILATIT